MTDSAAPPKTSSAAQAPRGSRWLRRIWYALVCLILALALGLAALWQWAGSEGSLARVLSWGQPYLPPGALSIDGLQGALRRGGEASHLRWSQGGLTVDVYDARYSWNPLALLRGRLHFSHLSARHIRVDDQRAPNPEPSAGPPVALGLPLNVQIDAIKADKLEIVNPRIFSAADVAGRYLFDGTDHQLHLENATLAQGTYQANVRLGTVAPADIDAQLSGNFLSPAPADGKAVPLSVKAGVRGPLTEMKAEAQVRGQPSQDGIPTARLDATARITPWAEQPLPEANADFSDLDVAPFWPSGPQTLLTGKLSINPTPSGWQVVARVANALPGAWDRQRLPLNQLEAQGTWQDSVATVQTLKAELAGGKLETTGSWAAPASPDQGGLGRWQLETSLSNIDPAQLHTQLAPFPLDGKAKVSGTGAAVEFDASLQARASRQVAEQRSPKKPAKTPAQGLAQDLSALRLQSAAAKGLWQDGLLRISHLRVRSTDAELTGSNIEARPKGPSGKGQLQLSAPGTLINLAGDVRERDGGGTLSAEISDLARAFDWVQKLPGVPPGLSSAKAGGRLSLNGNWQGGWADPSIKAELNVPAAEWQADATDQAALPLKLQTTSLSLNGRLAQARLDARGTLKQGERTLKLQATAEGGRNRAGATLATSSWQAVLQKLELTALDPALSQGRSDAPWQLSSSTPVTLSFSPAPGASGGSEFRSSAGELILTAPTRNVAESKATVTWQPIEWRAGTLSTSGRITGLPLAWAELFSGSTNTDSALSGDLFFDGRWDAQLGKTMHIDAELARTRGDLVVTTKDADTGVQNRIVAGVKDARIQLRSQGQAVTLRVNWDTEQLGVVTGELRSQLSATNSADDRTAWSWPESAPLSGEVRAALPRIAAWSRLAPPGWRLKGSLGADVRIAGTRGTPQLSGTLNADDLALRSIVDGIEFKDGRLRARLEGQRLVLDEFSLRGGGSGGDKAGGNVKATGDARLENGQVRASLNATLDHLHASLRTDRLVVVSGQVQAGMRGRESTLSGKLRIDQARITLPEDTAPKLGDDVVVRGARSRVGTQKALPSDQARLEQATERRQTKDGATLKSDVQIDLGNDFRLSGQGIDTRLAGQLQVATEGAIGTMPRITGAVNTVGGTFRAYSQQLNIETGEIRFNGEPTNPSLNVLALRPNYQSDQRVGVQITGSALLPRIRLYAKPDLPDSEKLAWLMLGRPAPSGGAEAAMLQQAALALIGGREGKSIASRFGLDELSFSGGGDSDTGTSGASVTFGKRLSDKLYATYEHSLAGAMGTVFVYYELSRLWLLRGQAGERSAVDLIYTLSFD